MKIVALSRLALIFPVAARAVPVLEIDPNPFDFGVQEFGVENVGTITLTYPFMESDM